MLYCFLKEKKSVHSICVELFNKPLPSRDFGTFIAIRSDSVLSCGYHTKIDDSIDRNIKDGSKVYCDVVFAFDNRMNDRSLRPKMFSEEAKEKFCSRSGLVPLGNQSCKFLGKVSEAKFSIRNAFHLTGDFLIKDFSLFEKSYHSGIGSRKSYGFGLIMAKPI